MDKRTFTIVACIIGLALFFGVNVLANASLRSVRFDLTEESLYTLSDGSTAIARRIDEPINLYFFYSKDLAADVPSLSSYGTRVREMLEEYVLESDDNLRLEIINPVPFSEEEDRAVAEGLFGADMGGEKLYFGLVATNSIDDKETIAFFDPSKERFLEYEVSRILHTLSNTDPSVVGIVSTLPIEGAPGNPMNPMMGQGTPAWKIVDHIGQFYDTRMLGTDFDTVEDDVRLMVLIHPKGLSDETTYAIDQFVLGGGRLLVYADAWCEADQSTADPQNPMSRGGAPSELTTLFDAWGIELVSGKLAGDRKHALRVSVGGPQGEPVPYVAWIGLDDEAFDKEDAVTSLLNSMIFATAGVLQKKEGSEVDFQPLVQTSDEAMKMDVGQIQFMPDPKRMLEMFTPSHERYTIAARLSGNVQSAFPDGPPAATPDPMDMMDEEGEDGEEAAADTDAGDHLAESTTPINVIVVSDVDHLEDRFWMQEQRLGPILLGYQKTSDNGDFLVNALENLEGGDNLISIRAQGRFQRPFDRVEEIRRDAEAEFLAEEQRLQRELQEAERRINELQREKTADQALILSPEQEAELEKIQDQQLATRKKLREVKLSLREDVEALGTRVKWLNILALPLLISVGAICLGTMRVRRRLR